MPSAMRKHTGVAGEIYPVPLEMLTFVPEFQPKGRMDEIGTEENPSESTLALAAYIASGGPLPPLIVRRVPTSDGKVLVTDGHRRTTASRVANMRHGGRNGVMIDSITCVTEPEDADDTTRDVIILAANSALPLGPLDRALVMQRMIGRGLGTAEVGKRLGVSPKHVCEMLKLLQAPSEVQAAVREKRMSHTSAIQVAKAPKAVQEEAIAEVASGRKVTARKVTEKRTDRVKRPSAKGLETTLQQVESGKVTKYQIGGGNAKTWAGKSHVFEDGIALGIRIATGRAKIIEVE